MICLKRLLNFYINSSIHVALSVVALSVVTFLEFGLSVDRALLSFVFFASITGYNFVKYFELAKFKHTRLVAWLKPIQIFSLLCFLTMCYYVFQIEKNTLLCLLYLGIVTFYYAIPLLPKYSSQNLRNISGLKIYLIALVWTGVTVFVPVINEGGSWSLDVFLTSTQRYLYIIVLMLPFEIRDLQFDSSQLSTIPQKIGIKRTKYVGFFLVFLIVILECLKTYFTLNNFFVFLIIMLITLVFLFHSKESQKKYYASFFVEAIPILWAIILIILG